MLGDGLERYPIELFAFTLMPNHWHMVLRAAENEGTGRMLRWVRRAREHVGRAPDTAPNRRSPRPQTETRRAPLRDRAAPALHRGPTRRTYREAACGLWRAQTAPREIEVMGSPAVRGAWAQPGWRRETRLTPGYGEVAALGHHTGARRLWRAAVWRDTTCDSKRFTGRTALAIARTGISPVRSPPQVTRFVPAAVRATRRHPDRNDPMAACRHCRWCSPARGDR